MRFQVKSRQFWAFLLAMALLLTSCGGGAKATTMHLKRTEGTVAVSDDAGKDVAPAENLGLYSGYGVDTKEASYAWIDLDEVKLTKMDENSQVEIKKEDKHLTIEVKSGTLFFNVTEPLADDETLDIRTSTMLVGIRGTCGWVTQDSVALLEGKVEVTAGEQSVTINAGEMAVLTAEGTLEVESLTAESVPAFVKAEVGEELDSIPEGIPEEIPDAPSTGPYTVLLKQYGYMADGVLMYAYEYFYDEQGYMQRMVQSTYNIEGNLIDQGDFAICDYDKEAGRGLCTIRNGTPIEIPCKPGTAPTLSGFTYGKKKEYVVVDPLVTTRKDKRDLVGPGGRMDLIAEHQANNEFYNVGYYAIYTMDENGYPAYIETYTPDGTLTGTCTLEWKTIG